MWERCKLKPANSFQPMHPLPTGFKAVIVTMFSPCQHMMEQVSPLHLNFSSLARYAIVPAGRIPCMDLAHRGLGVTQFGTGQRLLLLLLVGEPVLKPAHTTHVT